MRPSIVVALLIGLFLGSFVTLRVTRSGISKRHPEVQTEDKENKIEKDGKPKATPPFSSGSSGSKSIRKESSPGKETSSVSSHRQDKGVQACLDQLKPSQMVEWEAVWHRRVTDFLSSNDSFWDSKGHHSFDRRVIPSIVGKYRGNWQVSHNVNLKIGFSAEIKSETEGTTELQMSDINSGAKKGTTSHCTRDLKPTEDLGFDETKNAINMFWYNCNSQLLGSHYSQFSFKFPIGMQKGQRNRLEVFGLDEDFRWTPVGILDLEKL